MRHSILLIDNHVLVKNMSVDNSYNIFATIDFHTRFPDNISILTGQHIMFEWTKHWKFILTVKSTEKATYIWVTVLSITSDIYLKILELEFSMGQNGVIGRWLTTAIDWKICQLYRKYVCVQGPGVSKHRIKHYPCYHTRTGVHNRFGHEVTFVWNKSTFCLVLVDPTE